MTKQVKFGPGESLSPGGTRSIRFISETPEPTANSSFPEVPTEILDTKLLPMIKSFYEFAGIVHPGGLGLIPTLLFKAEYNIGTKGWVQIPMKILGCPKHMEQAYNGYTKVRAAKELIDDRHWEELETGFGYTKERAMVFDWFEWMKKRAYPISSGRVVPRTGLLSTSFTDWLYEWGMQVGFALGFAFGFGCGLGLGLGLGLERKSKVESAVVLATTLGSACGVIGAFLALLLLWVLLYLRRLGRKKTTSQM